MPKPGPREAAKIVAIAGGEIVGRTRLQKVGCLLELAGANIGFKYAYHIYGPYCEELAIGADDAAALDLLEAESRSASWGGLYSTYRASVTLAEGVPLGLKNMAQTAARADSVVLELAVTAAFLAENGHKAPWSEVTSRKKAKATPERIKQAKALYRSLASNDVPKNLPRLG